MKQILYIDTGFEFGGGTKSFLYLLENLDKSKYKPFVFFENDYEINGKKISKIVEEKGGKFINYKAPYKLSKFKKEILRLFSKNMLKQNQINLKINYVREFFNNLNFKPDLIHLNNHFGTNLEYILVANELNIPVIQHLRKNSALSKLEIDLLQNKTFFTISVSNATYNFYKKFLNLKNKVIYNPFLIDITPYKKVHNDKIKILFPANYLKLKGHFLVFNALEKVNNIELILAGAGKFDTKTEQLKNKLKKENKLQELGFVDLKKYYKDVDYVISFSENEGLPRVIIEGLLYGCGIISSDYNAAKEIFEISEKRNFYIIKREVNKLVKIFQNLKHISYKIPDEHIKKKFSLDTYINEIENFYKSLI